MIFLFPGKNFNSLARFSLVLLLIFTGHTQAASTSHKAAAEDLLALLPIQQQLDTIGRQVTMPLKQRLSMVRTSPARAELVRNHITTVEGLINQKLSWANTKAAYIDLYTATYSEDELKDLVKFFKSDVGRKYMSNKPEFNEGVRKITSESLETLKPQLQQLEDKLRTDMAKVAETEKAAKP